MCHKIKKRGSFQATALKLRARNLHNFIAISSISLLIEGFTCGDPSLLMCDLDFSSRLLKIMSLNIGSDCVMGSGVEDRNVVYYNED